MIRAVRGDEVTTMLRLAQEGPSTVERANGILMEYHGIDAGRALAMLRKHAVGLGVELVDVAGALVDSHRLLVPSRPDARAADATRAGAVSLTARS